MTIEARETQQPEHVLVVEDEEFWRSTYKQILGRRGLQVTTVSGVNEALDLLEKDNFNRVITDGLDGGWYTVAQIALKQGLPVKLISGNERHKAHAEEMGIEFISKGEFAYRASELSDQL